MAPHLPRLATGIAALAICSAGHAGELHVLRRTSVVADPTKAIARAPFDPGAFGDVFGRAVRTLRSEGYEFAECDAARGAIITRALELDVSCGRTTCLARQSYSILLGYRAARVTLSREIFDTAVRHWVPAAVEEAMPSAQVFVLEMVGPRSGERDRTRPAADPCRPAEALVADRRP